MDGASDCVSGSLLIPPTYPPIWTARATRLPSCLRVCVRLCAQSSDSVRVCACAGCVRMRVSSRVYLSLSAVQGQMASQGRLLHKQTCTAEISPVFLPASSSSPS